MSDTNNGVPSTRGSGMTETAIDVYSCDYEGSVYAMGHVAPELVIAGAKAQLSDEDWAELEPRLDEPVHCWFLDEPCDGSPGCECEGEGHHKVLWQEVPDAYPVTMLRVI
jgi:hypothetical protein